MVIIMGILQTKLRRDLLQMKSQALAIALVMACGIATFVMSLSTLQSLERTLDSYYEQYGFAQVFTHLKRAPQALASRLAHIPGVARLETRVVAQVTLDIAGLSEPATGRLISLPAGRQPQLNRLHLREGRLPAPQRRGEVLVNQRFAEAHGLKPGDRVQAILNGRRQALNIVGIALSPEYVYQIRPGELIPDDRRFGVFWMGYDDLAAAFDLEGAFNDVSLTLEPGAIQAEVRQRLDEATADYGGQGAYGREDQMSHKLVSNEMTQLRGMALIPPTIFLTVAAFLINVVLSRLISIQREQIAALKAFGYSRLEVGLHYLRFGLAISVAGAVLGTTAGAWFGRGMTRMYARFFSFPVFDYHLGFEVALIALLVSGGTAALGVYGSVRKAVELPPAEAMRPEPPAAFRPTVVERLGLQRFLTQGARMILRQLERRPFKALFSCLGIALAVAVMILGSFSEDIIENLIDFQFFQAQRQDMTVTLVEPADGRALTALAQLPGVRRAEPVRTVPVRLNFGHRSRLLAITGLPPDASLLRPLNRDGQPVFLPEQGLVLSAALAELLEVAPGQKVRVDVLEGNRPVRQIPVAALVEDYTGTSAYMRLRTLQQLMREEDSISGANLLVDSRFEEELYHRLKKTPAVAGVTLKRGALESFRKTMAENLLRMRLFNMIFASIIAFGVVYNSMRVALSERSRELATLRVIGFTRTEISWLLLGEAGLLTLLAIPLGLVLGTGFAALATWALQTEVLRFSLVVDPSTYGTAALVILLAAVASGLVVRRRLDRLDLIAVLKARE